MSEPEKLGKYVIDGVLGKGAMGVVYRGFDPFIERTVALKTVRKSLPDTDQVESLIARFRHEAQAAGRLQHPNIVAIYEYAEDESTAYIAMEFVEGRGLNDFLRRQVRFELNQVAALMGQLASALDYAHQHGVVHRDIKPANLIINAEGVLKVADFGIARIDTSQLTQVGSIIGTPSYMSPEQCQGRAVDGRSDIFSAGVVLYELLTGIKPFVGSVETVTYQICYETPRAPSELNPNGMPAAVDAVVARAIAKRPEERYATAGEMLLELRQALRERLSATAALDETALVVGALPDVTPAREPIDEAALRSIEQRLAHFLGPIARVIVKQAASATRDRDVVIQTLADHIRDPADRKRFVEGSREVTGSDAGAGTRTADTGARAAPPGTVRPAVAGRASSPGSQERSRAESSVLNDEFIESVRARLTPVLGPIARVVIKRCAQASRDRREFVGRLAEHLEGADRAAFLREFEP